MTTTNELSEAELTEEQKLAKIAQFGFDRPEEKPYMVHVYGPDDVEEFDAWLDAVTWAIARNAETVEYVARRVAESGGEPPFLTKSWATPYTREAAVEAGLIYDADPNRLHTDDRERARRA